MNARDHRRRTPLHVAAKEGAEEVIAVLLEKKADINVIDLDGNTALDLAAKRQHMAAFNCIVEHSFCPTKDNTVKKTLEKAMNPAADGTVRDDFVTEKIGELSPFRYMLAGWMLAKSFVLIASFYFTCFPFSLACSVVSMFKSEKCGGEGKFHFLEQFAKKPELKVMLVAVQCIAHVLRFSTSTHCSASSYNLMYVTLSCCQCSLGGYNHEVKVPTHYVFE